MPSSPLQFSVVAELNRDIDTINNLLTTGPGMEKWVPNCKSVSFTHPSGKLAAGSYRMVYLKGGIAAEEHVTFVESPLKLNYTVATMFGIRYSLMFEGYEGVTVLEPIGKDKYRFTWSVHYSPRGVLKLISPLVRIGLRQLIGTMVGNIARETGGRRVSNS